MWSIFLDGTLILKTYAWESATILFTAFGFGIAALRIIDPKDDEPMMPMLASIGIGTSVLCTILFGTVILAQTSPGILQPASFVIVGFACLLFVYEIKSGGRKRLPPSNIGFALFCAFALMLLRYAFLAHILLPPYSDSPIHYQIISGLLKGTDSNQAKLSLGSIFTNYYHFGFHALATLPISLTGISIEKAIALLGQTFLVIAPFSLAALTYAATKEAKGAWFAGLLAGIGWLMPAFAVNWGKYSAIVSLAVLPAVLAVLGRLFKDRERRIIRLFIAALLMAGTILLHTRSIFAMLLAGASMLISDKIQPSYKLTFRRALFFSGLFLLSLLPLVQLIKDFYSAISTVACFLILLPFAFQEYPKLALAIFIFIFGAWLITLSPFPLLDRQFLEILLYIPLSLMGGAGFSGLLKRIPAGGIARPLFTAALIGCVIFGFVKVNAVVPDPCCDYFQGDDQSAFKWIKANGNDQSLFIISSFSSTDQVMGTDAGVWIAPLCNQNVNKMPYDTDWGSATEASSLCSTGAKQIYIYMGGRVHSFDSKSLSTSMWFRPVFQSGKTKIFELIQCPQ